MNRPNGSETNRLAGAMTDLTRNACIILVIDDDPAMMSLLKDELSDEGCTVLQAYDGLEALSQLRCASPNLIVTDLHMKFGGMEFLGKLRTACPSCPIIVMTAFGDSKTKSSVLNAGMSGYFDKPVRMRDLKALLCQFCSLPLCSHRQNTQSISHI